MRLFTIFTFLLITTSVFSQTKEETELWIKSKIDAGGLTGVQDYEVYYDKEYLSIGNKYYISGNTFKAGYLIKIKCITNFYFKDYEGSIHLIIKTSSNCKVQLNDFSGGSITEQNQATLILDKSFADDNMKTRFTKAMNNLIKFYGGSVVKEAY